MFQIPAFFLFGGGTRGLHNFLVKHTIRVFTRSQTTLTNIRCLILAQTVCKGFQRTSTLALVGKCKICGFADLSSAVVYDHFFRHLTDGLKACFKNVLSIDLF